MHLSFGRCIQRYEGQGDISLPDAAQAERRALGKSRQDTRAAKSDRQASRPASSPDIRMPLSVCK